MNGVEMHDVNDTKKEFLKSYKANNSLLQLDCLSISSPFILVVLGASACYEVHTFVQTALLAIFIV